MGDPSELSTAVEAAMGAGEMAVSRAGDNPRARAVALNVLANARAAAFQVRGGRADIAAAVAAQREAVELLDSTDPDRVALQVNLADRLLAAYILTRERELVEEAVRQGEDVLARDLPNAWRAAALDGLGRTLRARYDHTGNRCDLERSAAAQAESLAGTPTAAPERAARLNNLANARWVSYQVTGDLGALDDAVAGYQRRRAPRRTRSRPGRRPARRRLPPQHGHPTGLLHSGKTSFGML